MENNPLIQRYRYSLLRPKDIWIYSSIYIGIVSLILFISYLIVWPSVNDSGKSVVTVHQGVYAVFAVLQIIILWLWGSYNTGSAIPNEILRKSYDFFRLLPSTPLQKATGVLFGSNLITYALGLVNFILLIIFGFLGGINPLSLFSSLLFLIAMTLLLNSFSLMSSINPSLKQRRNINQVSKLIVLGFFLLPYLSMFIINSKFFSSDVTFFFLKIPSGIFTSLVVFYFAGWILSGVIRKFRYEGVPLFSPAAAVLFLVGFEVLSLGIFWPYYKQEMMYEASRIVPLFTLFILSAGTLKDHSKYLEISRSILIDRYSGKLSNINRFLLQSNLSFSIGLFIIWSLFTFITSFAVQGSIVSNLFTVLNFFTFIMFFVSLFELNILCSQKYRKIWLLLVFMGLLSLFLPLILAASLRSDTVYIHSFFGYISSFVTAKDLLINNIMLQVKVLLVNLILCFITFYIIYKNYIEILKLRKDLE
ncbi:MAG: hypothetical protein PHV60_02285 [bacterium]|nr:hypothetical protein [bacterium]